MYKRVLLKISGEALAAGRGFGIDAVFIHKVAEEIAAVHALGCEIGIVVGGGNFFRGVAQQAIDMDRVAADHMGMLSTVINSIALQDAIEKRGLFCRVMSAIEMHEVAEPYIRRRAMRHLEKQRKSLFLDRYGGKPASDGDQGGHPAEGDVGRRNLHGGPEDRRDRDPFRDDHV